MKSFLHVILYTLAFSVLSCSKDKKRESVLSPNSENSLSNEARNLFFKNKMTSWLYETESINGLPQVVSFATAEQIYKTLNRYFFQFAELESFNSRYLDGNTVETKIEKFQSNSNGWTSLVRQIDKEEKVQIFLYVYGMCQGGPAYTNTPIQKKIFLEHGNIFYFYEFLDSCSKFPNPKVIFEYGLVEDFDQETYIQYFGHPSLEHGCTYKWNNNKWNIASPCTQISRTFTLPSNISMPVSPALPQRFFKIHYDPSANKNRIEIQLQNQTGTINLETLEMDIPNLVSGKLNINELE